MNKYLGLSLFCEANINLPDLGKSWKIQAGPCFGRFFHDGRVSDCGNNYVHTRFKATIYQLNDSEIAIDKCRKNNFCSLTESQLAEWHKEIMKITNTRIEYGGEMVDTNVKITFKQSDSYVELPTNDGKSNCPAWEIQVTADYLTFYQIKVLCTLIRLSSEAPNSIALREAFNLHEHGMFTNLSVFSLYVMLCNRLQYGYDQSLYCTSTVQMIHTKFYKPISLNKFKERYTLGTDAYKECNGRVQNFIPVVERSVNNKEKFKFLTYYQSGALDKYNSSSRLYSQDEVVKGILFEGKIHLANVIRQYQQIYDAIFTQFNKMEVDNPCS